MTRVKGEGSWRTRKDGRLEYAIPIGKTATGHTKRQSFYGTSKKEIMAQVQTWRKVQLDPGKVKPTALTLDDLFARHLEHREKIQGRITALTRQDYQKQYERHIAPALGQMRLSDLCPTDIANWQTGLLKVNVGGRTLEYTHRILKAALEFAVQLRLIAVNPAATVPSPQKVRSEKQSFTRDEARAYLEAAAGLRFSALFVLVLTTGLRRSEVLGLRWEDVDAATLEIRVRQRIRWKAGGGFDVGEPKTKRSRRTIPISKGVMVGLEQHREQQALERSQAGENWHELGLVFTSREGNPLHATTLADQHEGIIKRAGIKRLTFHELRHSFTSLARAAGVDLKVISDILGHHSAAFTMDFYQHIFEDQRREVARSAEELTGAKPAEPIRLSQERLELWRDYCTWLGSQPNRTCFASRTARRFKCLLEPEAHRERDHVRLVIEVYKTGWQLRAGHLERLAELETESN